MVEEKFAMMTATEENLRRDNKEFWAMLRRAAIRSHQPTDVSATELELSHAHLRAALTLAVEEIHNLNADRPLIELLQRVLREAESAANAARTQNSARSPNFRARDSAARRYALRG
jgi:hypothetical protein